MEPISATAQFRSPNESAQLGSSVVDEKKNRGKSPVELIQVMNDRSIIHGHGEPCGLSIVPSCSPASNHPRRSPTALLAA